MNFPDRAEVDRLVDDLPFPSFAKVRYDPSTETIDDPEKAVRSELERLDLDHLDPGAKIAVGAGSRGITGMDAVIEETVSYVSEQGFEPVVVPAMGSHGGATPEGQREVLEALGITEESVGAPIDARMDARRLDTVTVGDTEMPVYFSEAALDADAILVANRIKAHTSFTGPFESGLTKMTVVGLGKQAGANAFHSTAIAEGYVETLSAALDVILESAPVLGGIGLVENFDKETAHIEAIQADSFRDREPELLELAYDEMATLPIDDIDLLVVDELGKDISGTGMDTNVIGRYRVLNAPDPEKPDIDLIYVRNLTESSKGNGTGIGLADVTRRSAIEQFDVQKTYANAITSGSLPKAKIPIVAPDDELAMRISLAALGGYDPETVRIVWIKNTQKLDEFYVSESLIDELPDAATVVGRERLTFPDGDRSFNAE